MEGSLLTSRGRLLFFPSRVGQREGGSAGAVGTRHAPGLAARSTPYVMDNPCCGYTDDPTADAFWHRRGLTARASFVSFFLFF